MFEGLKVLKQGDVAVLIFACSIVTSALTTIGGELWARHARPAAPAPAARPALVQRTTGTETVASIPTRLDGRDTICTLRIDYKTRTWSLAC